MIATIATIVLIIVASPYFFMALAPEEPQTEQDVIEYGRSEYCLVDGELIEYSLN
jgi:hypothetical protein